VQVVGRVTTVLDAVPPHCPFVGKCFSTTPPLPSPEYVTDKPLFTLKQWCAL
jgi:hypothetical protein